MCVVLVHLDFLKKNFIYLLGNSVFFQHPSSLSQVVVFSLVVESAAHWPM